MNSHPNESGARIKLKFMSKRPSFQEELHKRRTRICMTIDELAELTGIPRNVVNRYLSGKEFPSSLDMDRICEAMMTSKSQIFGTRYFPPAGIHNLEVVITNHARERFKKREVDGTYIRAQLLSMPYSEGTHKWYIPKTKYFVAYADTGGWRVVLTSGQDITRTRGKI